MKSVMQFIVLLLAVVPTLAQDDVQPAPPSISADVPVTYFGPPPYSVQKELIGPYQLLKAGTVDLNAATVTLPLYK